MTLHKLKGQCKQQFMLVLHVTNQFLLSQAHTEDLMIGNDL